MARTAHGAWRVKPIKMIDGVAVVLSRTMPIHEEQLMTAGEELRWIVAEARESILPAAEAETTTGHLRGSVCCGVSAAPRSSSK